MNQELPDAQAGFRKGKSNWRSNCQHLLDHREREFQKNTYLCFTDYAKAFEFVDHNKLWKIFKDVGISDHLTCLPRNLYAAQAAAELDMEQWTGSKLGKEFVKAIDCHPAYLTFMQSTSCKMSDWMNQAGIKIARRNINNLRYEDNSTLLAESKKGLKSVLMRVKEKSEKAGLKQHSKN